MSQEHLGHRVFPGGEVDYPAVHRGLTCVQIQRQRAVAQHGEVVVTGGGQPAAYWASSSSNLNDTAI